MIHNIIVVLGVYIDVYTLYLHVFVKTSNDLSQFSYYNIIDCSPCAVHDTPVRHLFYTWKFLSLILPHLFYPSPCPLFLWPPSVCFLDLCIWFVLFYRCHIQVKSCVIFLSLSHLFSIIIPSTSSMLFQMTRFYSFHG